MQLNNSKEDYPMRDINWGISFDITINRKEASFSDLTESEQKKILKEINNMKTIEIYLQDLTAEKQAEILETLGDNGNYDVFPIATLEFEDEEDC